MMFSRFSIYFYRFTTTTTADFKSVYRLNRLSELFFFRTLKRLNLFYLKREPRKMHSNECLVTLNEDSKELSYLKYYRH